ncbi:MAG: cytochrome C, partial [Acidobacteria bacterium]|nr:cytochrome C [Acidobacteriota bacterium]
PTQTCMNCHSQIWTSAPLLEPVRESFRSGKSLVWNRVNDLPDFVYFDHSIHINKGVGCNTCHGPVDRMPLMFNNASLQMEWCIECHRAPEKNLRPREQVFNMRYQQPTRDLPVVVDGKSFTDQLSLGKYLVHDYHVRTVMDITSCSTCHR